MESKRIELIFQEPIKEKTMSIFREDFQLEKKSGNYMKLEKGDNKLRILSPFIDGYEEWDENKKPVRYREKPESPREGIKQFVACVVWNYKEKKVQILQLTQVSIIRAIQNLSEDTDWGPVFNYDIKITRIGDNALTKYSVNPLPAKPLDAAIEKAFKDKPCNLEALFTNGDPFAEGQSSTPAFVAKPVSDKVTEEQADELIELIGDDADYRKEFENRLKKAFNSPKFSDIPASQYAKIKDVIMEHNKKRLDAEMKKAG